MKYLTFVCHALLGVIFTAPAWSHHLAEGIISDEIWNQVDSMVSGTPHGDLDLEIDFADVMGSMSVDEAPEGGSIFLVSSYKVEYEDFPVWWEAFEQVMEAIHETKGDPEGNCNSSYMPVVIDVDDCLEPETDVDECQISLLEPIGSIGWTEDPRDVYYPPEAPGPSAQNGKGGN